MSNLAAAVAGTHERPKRVILFGVPVRSCFGASDGAAGTALHSDADATRLSLTGPVGGHRHGL